MFHQKCGDQGNNKISPYIVNLFMGCAFVKFPVRVDVLGFLNWWVNAAYAVHNNMKGHMGGAFSMGKGIIYGTSTQQKLVTQSSTEADSCWNP